MIVQIIAGVRFGFGIAREVFDPVAEILALIAFQKLADGDVFKKSPKTIRTIQRASAIVRRFFEYKRYSS